MRDQAEYKNFLILFDIEYSFTILMVRLFEKIRPEKNAVMQWHTQDGNITTNLKGKVDFKLLALSVTNVMTCIRHVDDSDV